MKVRIEHQSMEWQPLLRVSSLSMQQGPSPMSYMASSLGRSRISQRFPKGSSGATCLTWATTSGEFSSGGSPSGASICTDTIRIGRYILVYPQGCDVCNHLSLFLCVADYDKLLPGELALM